MSNTLTNLRNTYKRRLAKPAAKAVQQQQQAPFRRLPQVPVEVVPHSIASAGEDAVGEPTLCDNEDVRWQVRALVRASSVRSSSARALE